MPYLGSVGSQDFEVPELIRVNVSEQVFLITYSYSFTHQRLILCLFDADIFDFN